MTEDEYVQSVPPDEWLNEIIDLARIHFERLMNTPGVLDAALEEFHNDAWDNFAQNGPIGSLPLPSGVPRPARTT